MTNVNLMHGDCLERMSEIPDGSVDMILADLPYGTTACKWDVVIPFEPLWKHYWRVIKANGAVVLFGSEPFSSHLRMSQIKKYKYDWVWDKQFGSNFANSNKQPLKYHETISVFYSKQPIYNKQMSQRSKPLDARSWSNSKKTSNVNFRTNKQPEKTSKLYTELNPNSILTFNAVAGDCNNTKRKHPSQKSTSLLEYLIRTYTNEGETVLDNVMGSGSTGVACLNTQRKFIGIEKDATYFEIAKKRIGESLG